MSYTAKVIAVLGRTLRAGRWKLADDSLVIALFGKCVLDLNRAYVDEEHDELYMQVFCLFGSVSIVLPPGCDVEPSGIALLASSEVEIPSDKAEDITTDVLAPLDISWFCMFGRVRINEFSPEIEEPEPSELGAPATEVFGDDDDTTAEERKAAARAAAEERAQAAEEDALRGELAQWRSEKGAPAPDPASEIDDEPQAEPEPPAEEAADEPAGDAAADDDTPAEAEAADGNDGPAEDAGADDSETDAVAS